MLKVLKNKRSYFSVVLERFMQGIDDYQLTTAIEKRFTHETVSSSFASNAKVKSKEKVIVLGSGWGSHAFLKTIDASQYDISIVSPRNFFLFTPMLAGTPLHFSLFYGDT